MPAVLALRPAEPADAASIARVHVDAWRSGYRDLLADELLAALSEGERERMWSARLRGEDPGYVRRHADVALLGEALVGFVVAGPGHEGHAATAVGEVSALYVHPDHWSMGVGGALLSSAVERLGREGCARALLWVLATNVRARRFYESHGWVSDGHIRTRRLGGVPDFSEEVQEARYWRGLG